MRNLRGIGRSVAGLLPAVWLLTPPAVVAQPGQGSPAISIVVALEALGPLEELDPDSLARFVLALEAQEQGAGVSLVVERALALEPSLPGQPERLDPDQLRRDSLESGAHYLVIGRVTRLAEAFSLDVRVLETANAREWAHLVYEGHGSDEFVAALHGAAADVRDVLGRSRAAEPSPVAPILARAESGIAAVGAGPGASEVVVEIRVRGNRRIEADAVRAVLGTRVGEPLQRARIGEDVRRVYKLGFFRNVQIHAFEAAGGQGVEIVVEEHPVIRQVSVAGNESMGSDDIKEQLTLTVGSTTDYPLLLENQARIEALYKAKGFHRVRVSYEEEVLGEGTVAIHFDIVEGGKLRLVEIEFEGNESLETAELRKTMQTKPWGWTSFVSHYWDNSGIYAEPVFFQDLDRVLRRYMDEGFIRARVGEPELAYDEDGLRVKVSIEEGPRFTVGNVDVQGDESMNRDELWELVELEEGEVFSRSTLTADIERLQSHYADRGFYSAKVTPRTRVDDEARRVDCVFEVEKGGLFFVDRIEVHGNTRTRDQVIRREMGLAEGEVFSAVALDRSRARVRRLGFFEEVSLEIRHLDEPHRVAVDVDVVERPTGSFSFGAGFGSTDGFLVNASIRQDNLFGKGYGLTASIDLGSQNSNIFLRFSDPYFLGSPATMSGTFSRTEREFLDFDQQNMGFEVNVSYPLDEGETRMGTGYSFTEREVSGIQEFQAASLLQREELQGSSETSMLTVSMVRDTRDDIRFPRSGQVSGLALEFAGLGGINQFLRLEGRTTWFLPVKRWLGFESTFVVNSRIGWAVPFNDISDFDLPGCEGFGCQSVINAANADLTQLGDLTTIDKDLKLPLTERYFLGGLGAFQVRGFKQRSLGPRRTILNRQEVGGGEVLFNPTNRLFNTSLNEKNGVGGPRCVDSTNNCNDLADRDIDDFEDLELADVIGGNKMFLLNLELQFPIAEEMGLRGLVFLDMGNAFAENESINPADFRFGVGAGVQWFSPFGPILLELGFPLDKLEDEDGSVFEFSFGGSSY